MSANLAFLKDNVNKNETTNKKENNSLLGNVIKNTVNKMNTLINSDKTFFSSFYTWIIFIILLFIAIVLS